MIASHYVEPLQRHLKQPTFLQAAPDANSEQLADLEAGATVRILDKRSGWAWGYADGLVGYLPAAALTA